MGNKISWEDSEKLAAAEKHNSIYAKPNKYGYKIAINHPKIKPLYERFKDSKNARILSDKERFEFEAIIVGLIEKRRKNEKNMDS